MKSKSKLWLVTVPKQLDIETRQFVERNSSSIINFVRKSIRYLTEDEPPQQSGKRSVLWNIRLHPDLHKKAIDLVKSNYPSKSSLVRYAVTRQLTAERYMDEETKTLLAKNQVLKENIASLKSEIERIVDAYFKLENKLRELKK